MEHPTTIMEPFTQKGSCRDQHHRHTLLSESLFCSVCKYHASFSDGGLRRKLKNKSIEINNICEDLLRTLFPDTISAKEVSASGTSRKRQHNSKSYFHLMNLQKEVVIKKLHNLTSN